MQMKKLSKNYLLAEQTIAAQQAEEQANPRLNVDQAGRYLGVSVSTLNRWRCSGTGPEWCKLGGRVFYYLADLQAFRS